MSLKTRAVIIGAAQINNYQHLLTYLNPETDFYIVCDAGLNHISSLKITPDLIIGDFDSHKNPELNIETIVLPHEKDDTDSVFALKTALQRGFKDFLFLGMLGNRFDHSLGNLYMLVKCHEEHVKALMIDDYSEFEIVSKTPVLIPDSFEYFSLINITGTARHITIKDALYTLDDAEIPVSYQYGVSNEVLKNKTASVTCNEGCLLLIKDF